MQVALLQETHLTDLEHLKLKRDWVGQLYYSSFNSKSGGVAIHIHKHLAFTLDKVIRDTDGRFIIITGVLYGEIILIGSVYAPNTSDSSFYSKLLADISSVCPPYVILGRDFNCGMSSDMDYSPPKTQPLQKWQKLQQNFAQILVYLTHGESLILERKISHFSLVHTILFLEFLFPDQSLTRLVPAPSARVLSDHSSVSIELLPPYYDPFSRHWRLNPSLLSNPAFLKYLENQWELFMSTNDSPEVSASTLWEAGKAFLRGSIISYTAAKRKSTLAKQLKLEHDIVTLERDFKETFSTFILKKLEAAKSALDQLLM